MRTINQRVLSIGPVSDNEIKSPPKTLANIKNELKIIQEDKPPIRIPESTKNKNI